LGWRSGVAPRRDLQTSLSRTEAGQPPAPSSFDRGAVAFERAFRERAFVSMFAFACASAFASGAAAAQTSDGRASPDALRPSPSAPASAVAPQGGALVVYGSTSDRFARYLVDDFRTLHPDIQVTYVALPPAEVDARMRRNARTADAPDVVWSAAMDLQMKAALEGYALAYESPEARTLPRWANWKNSLYATTYEPLLIAYNKRYVQPGDVPATHGQLADMLVRGRETYRGKVSTYALDNPEFGSIGFQFDAATDTNFWKLARALEAVDVASLRTSAEVLDRVSAGTTLIAYNVAGSEALRRARRDPLVGVQFTQDYNLVLTRPMFIMKSAPHPHEAKAWLDFVLSARGQKQMQIADMMPLREVPGDDPAIRMLRLMPRIARPVALDARLAQVVSTSHVRQFEKRWASTFDGNPPASAPAQRSSLSSRDSSNRP